MSHFLERVAMHWGYLMDSDCRAVERFPVGWGRIQSADSEKTERDFQPIERWLVRRYQSIALGRKRDQQQEESTPSNSKHKAQSN
jgi:hypothetical protein